MGTKPSISPGTLAFAGIGLIVSIWMLLSGTKGGYEGGTQRIKVPQGNTAAAAESQSVLAVDTGVGAVKGKIVQLDKTNPDDLVAGIVERSIFRKTPDISTQVETPREEPVDTPAAPPKVSPVSNSIVPHLSQVKRAGVKPKEEKPYSPPKLVLKGIATIGDTAYALISGSDSGEGYYSEGSGIAGTDISVKEITSGGVTLVKDDYSWEISMPDTFKSTPLSGK